MGSPTIDPMVRYYGCPILIFFELQLQHGQTDLDKTLQMYVAVTIVDIQQRKLQTIIMNCANERPNIHAVR